MTPEDLAALRRAVRSLEHPGLAASLTNMVGKPIELIGNALPASARQAIATATSKALQAALKVALRTMPRTDHAGSGLLHKALATASGAAGGAFGLATLPVELPVSTIIMLRSIAEIARSHGEDPSDPESALSCIQVFALGGRAGSADASETGTFSERLGTPLAQRANPGPCPGNPEALGVARVVEIDTTGGPGFGFEHFKAYDFLRDGEVVLTFDDGPWPGNTPAVLRALAEQCTKAIFFPIGKHAIWHPEILKQVAAAGHTIGSHTWSHADLSKLTPDQAKEEIEKGVSAVRVALGQPEASFFRFPALRHSPELLTYLSARNIATFSTDMDSFDFKMRKSEQIIESVVSKLKKHAKGIVLMHDFQHPTSLALPELLVQLKSNGYKIVQVKAKEPVQTLAEYDQQLEKELGGGTGNSRPILSVVRTISE